MAYSKFCNKRTRVAGYTFDSGGESQCFQVLQQDERDGVISGLRCQVQLELVAGITYRADFKFFDVKLGEEVWGEYKGFETPEWRLKLRLWKVFGPGRLRIWRGRFPRFLVEDVLSQGMIPTPRSAP